MSPMSLDFLELSPQDPDPAIACDRGVPFATSADRQSHAPDVHLLAIEGGSLVARCSCWWRDTAALDGQRLGIIGHYAAANATSALALLGRACDTLAAAGCKTAAGPMDGTTWRRYRFIVDRGSDPVFFLEPDNPDEWPRHWSAAGFSPLATYTSAANEDLTAEDARTDGARARLTAAGISIRRFDSARAVEELRRMFLLSLTAFSRNFLYTPISETEFLAQNSAVLPFVRPELIILAERDGALLGFMFALPDLLQARRGAPVDTVIVKTMAVDPSASGIGLGGVLVDLVQRSAREMGFRRTIHALMHETNVSRRISDRYARTIRRYALLSRSLAV
jgi:GNAT superfamily N-acetyltransferase